MDDFLPVEEKGVLRGQTIDRRDRQVTPDRSSIKETKATKRPPWQFFVVAVIPAYLIFSSGSPRAAFEAKNSQNAEPVTLAANVALSGSELKEIRASFSTKEDTPATRVKSNQRFEISLPPLPDSSMQVGGHLSTVTPDKNVIVYSLEGDLQRYVNTVIKESGAPHVAIVAMNPRNGRILAMGGRSPTLENPVLHAEFPAASLFKVVTATAALESNSFHPEFPINFRGGIYTLAPSNYLPDRKRDTRKMSLAEALGKSCNPVFARIALKYLEPSGLEQYAMNFGFNTQLPFDMPLPMSRAVIPDDDYAFSRSAAGFGEVGISPVHAASIIAGLSNGGVLVQPSVLDRVLSPDGTELTHSSPKVWRRIAKAETAETMMHLLQYTTTQGTSKKEFMYKNKPVLGAIDVAGKTGTLRGENPQGINNWFIGAAPLDNPEIAIAVIAVYPSSINTRASRLARKVLQKFFELRGEKREVVEL